jgi:hypothetical protein
MHNIDSIYFFVFVFTILVVLRTATIFVGSLLQNPPKKLVLSNRELILNGLSLSYILTYIIK